MQNNWLHRTTKAFHANTDAADMTAIYGGDFSAYTSNATWIYDPDMSAVTGQPSKYWLVTGDLVTLMDQAAMDAVDAALLTAARDAVAAQLDETEDVLRAFMLVVLDEINTLRVDNGRAERTVAQLKTAIRNTLGN